MGILSSLFGNKSKQIQEFIDRGAILLDVRTKSEFADGGISGCTHIPLQQLSVHMEDLISKNKPIIAYCAKGIRSNTAAKILRGHGVEAINGGGINYLKKKLNLPS